MTCSYQTIARYDELSYCGRARCMGDIRQRHREEIQDLRCQTRLIQRLKIRHLYQDRCDDYDPSDHDYYSAQVDDTHYSSPDHCDPTNWFSDFWCDPQAPFSNAPSPSLSSEPDWCHSSLSGSPAPKQRRRQAPRTRHELLKTRKRVQAISRDPQAIKTDYQNLRFLMESNKSKPQYLSMIASSRWTTIANAIDGIDQALVNDALNLVTELVTSRAMDIANLLSILQQGLLITLKDSLSRMGNHHAEIIRFFLSIVQVEPTATPYIVDIMSDTCFLDIFGELVVMGASEEIRIVIQFYLVTSKTLYDLSQMEKFIPIVPDNIAQVNTSSKLTQLYEPTAILKKIFKPTLFNPVINWLFKQIGHIENDTFESGLNLMISCLSYINYHCQSGPLDPIWVNSMVDMFQHSHIEALIRTSIESGSIQDYPDSIQLELEQFRDIYKQWTVSMSGYLRKC